MRFTKMHGLGNDFLLVYGQVPQNAAALCSRWCHRRLGIGADGVIFLSPSQIADSRIRIFNADGSEAKMCGNGIRCVGKFLYENGLVSKDQMTVETLSGIKTLYLRSRNGQVGTVAVDMGLGKLLQKDVPLLAETGTGIMISMGNPHMVVFPKDPELISPQVFGPQIENDPRFPGGINVEFVQVLSSSVLRMRVWERGCGVTPACGTGACAVAFAAVKQGICSVDKPIEIRLDGGSLSVTVDTSDLVRMEGPAVTVFRGEIEV